ncbi:MAG: hypothetical protein JJ863_06700 [Deltaproteobacteria bacterium]|nr:hypothetical protein [Deltaproteobacteria bacterium]
MTKNDELSIDIDLDPAFDVAPLATEDSGILDLPALLEEQKVAEAAGETRPLVAIAPPLVAERDTRPRASLSLIAWGASMTVLALSAMVFAAATPRSAPSEPIASVAKHEISTGGFAPVAEPAAPVALTPEPELVTPEPEPVVAAVTPRPRARTRAPAPAPEPSRPAPSHTWDSGSADGEVALDSSIDELLDRAIGAGTSADPMRETLPATPTRRQVSTTLRALEGEVRECAESGVARVRLVVDGSTGRVSSASVSGEHAGTSVASCVARAVRTAHFPRFERERFVIDYPYVL